VEELTGEVKWAKTEHERSGLFGDRSPSGSAPRGSQPAGNTELLNKALDVQKKTEQSLMSTQKMVEQSKEVAVATGEQLREQRQQIVTITDEVMRMEDNLTRADKLIRVFARRMATDRVILMLAFLVFAGIAGIVIYKSVNPNDKTFYVPDEVTPPNPVGLYNKTVSAINATIHGS
jgi:novel plant SNARE